MNMLDELRKQVQEMEEAACALLRVRGENVKIVSNKNLDKGRQAYQNGEKYWVSAIPLMEYEDAK